MANSFAAITRLLVDVSVRALLLAVLTAIVLRFWRPRDANFQHRAWTAVLWGMLLLPILAPLTPALSLLPSGWRWGSRPVIAQSIAQSSPAPEKTILAEPEFLDNAALTARTDEPSQAIVPAGSAASSTATQNIVARRDERHAVTIRQAAATPKTAAFGWPGVISVLYLCGVALLLARLALGYLAVRRLVRRSTEIPQPVGCHARMATSDAVRVPVSAWLRKPVILLPADWHRWSDALLASVVMHEQAHIDRRDHLVLLVSELNRCLYWFHPVAWFLRRRLSALAEQCCDDIVIAALQSRGDYARHLLEIASRLITDPRRALPLGISMARSSQVESRIIAILDERRPLSGRIGRGGALALAAIVGPIVLLAAGLRAADPPQPAADKAEAPVNETQAQAEPEKSPVKGPTVSGRVVLEADDSPVAGAEVRLLLNDAQGIRESERDVASDEQGHFVFHDVPDGPHRLVAVTANMASRRERINADWMKVVAGVAPAPLVLKLSPAPLIKVHVTSKADGKPLAGAVVRLPQIGHDVTVDAKGDAVLVGLTPENWEVRAQAEGFAAETAEIKLQGTQQGELSFALAPGGKIHGTVKDKEGKPLARTWVGLRREEEFGDPVDGMWTDAQGRFHFDFVPFGDPLTINTGQEPYLHTQQNVNVPRGGDVEVNIVLDRRPKGGSVQGIVRDKDGKPIAGATVTNGWRDSRERREAFTNAAGRFTIDDVFTGGKGTFVVARAKGFAPQAVEFTPGPADDPAEVTFKLEPGHSVRGHVIDAADKPIAGARVTYESEGRSGVDDIGGDATTDADGRFEFDSLPANCAFGISAKGYSSINERKLALDDPQEAVIRLQPQGIIRGRVVNAVTREPMTKFRVRIRHSPDRKPDDPKGGGIPGRLYNAGQRFDSADGQFVLDDFSVGSPLQVLVDVDGFETASLRRVVPQPADEAEIVEIKLTPTDPAKLATFAGIIVDDQGQLKAGAQLRLVVLDPEREYPNQSYMWRKMSPARVKQIDSIEQFLSAVSAADGSFHFDGVRTDKDIELAWWGEGVPEGEMRHLEKLPQAERTAIRIESPTPGAIQGKVNRQALPNLREISVGSWNEVEFPEDSTKADYLIRNLRPGRYELQVRAQARPTDKNRRGPLKTIQSQTVTIEGGKTLTVDIGFETDPGPGAISPASAKPTAPTSTAKPSAKPQQPINEPAEEEAVLTGRVVDDQGKPMPDALVSLPIGFARAAFVPAHPLRTQTNAAGQFSFRIPRGWLAPTEGPQGITVWAYAPGHALAFLSVDDQLKQRPPGEIELVLGPATDTAFRIVDPQGKPLVGARVVPWNFKAGGFAPPEEIAALIDGTSDADGLARLPAIDRNGWQMVLVKAVGFGDQGVRPGWGNTEIAPTTTIPLRPVGRLEVKVTGDALERLAGLRVFARTADRKGEPFSGLPLGLPPTEGHAAGVTDENGEFIAPELAVGETFLNLAVDQQQPLRPQVPKEIRIAAGQTTRVEVPLVKAQRVRGLVRTKPDGKPVANAWVTLMHHLGSGTAQHEQVRTDAEGRFEAYALPGEVVLHVGDLPGLMKEPDRRGPQRDEVAAQEGVVELRPIEMVATKTIAGHLVDQFDRPVAGVRVVAGDGPARQLAADTTGSDGSFSLQLPFDAEPSYLVRAQLLGSVDADVVRRDPLVLRVRMAYPPAKKP